MTDWLLSRESKILRQRGRTSDTQMDLMKLYGMFCVVYAHTFSRGFTLNSYLTVSSVYVIQLFMFCSGFFYRAETDRMTFLEVLKKYTKGYLLPYYIWNLVYGLINLGLRALGIISYGEPVSVYSVFVQPWVHGEQFALNTPAWFLLALFLVATLNYLMRHLAAKCIQNRKVGDHVLLIFAFLLSIAALFLIGSDYQFGVKATILRAFILLPYYQIGYVYRNYWRDMGWKTGVLVMAVCLLLQIILPIINGEAFRCRMIYSYFSGNPVLLALTAASAVIMITQLCRYAAQLVQHSRLIIILGRCTMQTMLHHLLVLFLIQLALSILHTRGLVGGFSQESFSASIWYQYSVFGELGHWMSVGAGFLVPACVHGCVEWVILRCASRVREKKAVRC